MSKAKQQDKEASESDVIMDHFLCDLHASWSLYITVSQSPRPPVDEAGRVKQFLAEVLCKRDPSLQENAKMSLSCDTYKGDSSPAGAQELKEKTTFFPISSMD